eukprot:6460241-Amphidinium_carterae.1
MACKVLGFKAHKSRGFSVLNHCISLSPVESRSMPIVFWNIKLFFIKNDTPRMKHEQCTPDNHKYSNPHQAEFDQNFLSRWEICDPSGKAAH